MIAKLRLDAKTNPFWIKRMHAVAALERGRGVLNELSGLINTGPDPHKKPKVRPSVW